MDAGVHFLGLICTPSASSETITTGVSQGLGIYMLIILSALDILLRKIDPE